METRGPPMLPTPYVRRLDASDDDASSIDVLAFEIVRTESLGRGDLVLCTDGDVTPVGGVVVDGRAEVEVTPAWAGRAPQRAFSARGLRVSAGTRVAAGHLVIRVDG